MKIKITEYLPGATREEIASHLSQQPRNDGIRADELLSRVQGAIGQQWTSAPSSFGAPAQATTRFYTIQRVNGTGPNAKDEGSGGHRHSLEDSDRIKKNSVIRSLEKTDRVRKKIPVSFANYHTTYLFWGFLYFIRATCCRDVCWEQ